MSGIMDLEQLLAEMNPILHHEEYVFCTFPDALYGDHIELQPIVAVQEGEGLTLVIPREVAAEHDIPCTATFRLLTLMVHSSLEAVGLTAVVATRLVRLVLRVALKTTSSWGKLVYLIVRLIYWKHYRMTQTVLTTKTW